MSRFSIAPVRRVSFRIPHAASSFARAGLFARALAVAIPLALAIVPTTRATPALAMGAAPCTLEILVDGHPIPEYIARGNSYVEALAGREYAVRLTNRSDRRIAVALSVDGLNSIDAKTTTAADATKWILGPYESITIDGWQTSAQTARQFFFTTEPHSYGAWLGKTRNLGVIAAAVFRERLPQPRPLCGDRIPCPYGGSGRLEKEESRDGANSRQRSANAPPASPTPADEPTLRAEEQPKTDSGGHAPSGSGSDSEHDARRKDTAHGVLSDELAATGIGREKEHHVIRVPFDAEPAPAALLEVRYEYRDALVKLGVLPYDDAPTRLSEREHAHGFADGDFAPDPYRGGRR